MLKKIILFIALPLPVLVFLFLKFFGKNEFQVPVYYQEGIGRNIQGCQIPSGPYALSDTLLKKWGWNGQDATVLIVNPNGITKNLARVQDLFDKGDYQSILLADTSRQIRDCVLLAGDTSQVVLIDGQRRIRGYYTPLDTKETDRLAVEIRILLKQY